MSTAITASTAAPGAGDEFAAQLVGRRGLPRERRTNAHEKSYGERLRGCNAHQLNELQLRRHHQRDDHHNYTNVNSPAPRSRRGDDITLAAISAFKWDVSSSGARTCNELKSTVEKEKAMEWTRR